MRFMSGKPSHHLLALAMLAMPVSGGLMAQTQAAGSDDVAAGDDINIYGQRIDGPEVKGFISARKDNRLQVTTEDGSRTVVAFDEATKLKATSGLFGRRTTPTTESLLNGLPVTIKTAQLENGELVARQITFRNNDFKTAAMIRTGTAQGFEEQTAATEALRGRVGDIDQYNVKSTINVNFDTGKAVLSQQAKADLCNAAATAEGMDNALLLVVGYTDATGSEDFNQVLSEKRAARVVNYLQQACRWKPYRMLTPTGMAMADPVADNTTPEGKAQNRRVAVNVLVSKAVEGL
ncbi:OmpA family protein [Sphingobium lignivorans]|uniref:Outer membrane protein OmpA-like peptidoglycan-associated protein n=1 Tax=Sphingobium lignivorans TaxID=2735886 RepID=A0ABR6NGF5_9SPHN|nr:OmpA family protein [Sphingobium lignivorans]MBB5986370.1 outer membrane protein OmpA-like peptidoglycan-associated protein [Sphingobium lignivorans]